MTPIEKERLVAYESKCTTDAGCISIHRNTL